MSERHTFVSAGIYREAFQDAGVRLTTEDPDLEYYIHAHKYEPHRAFKCNDRCQVVRTGKVEFVTRSDAANAPSDRVS